MKKVFIATDKDGDCYAYSEKPIFNGEGFLCEKVIGKIRPDFAKAFGIPFPNPGEMIERTPPAQATAPEPEPPEMEKTCCTCKWDYDVCPQGPEKDAHRFPCDDFANWEQREEAAETSKTEPEPPAETLVPITDLSQLKVGDKVKGVHFERTVLALAGNLVALSWGDDHDIFGSWWTMKELNYGGYQQVVTAPRTLNRDEAKREIDGDKMVRHISSGKKYGKYEDSNKRFLVCYLPEGRSCTVVADDFDIPEGRYEIVQ